MDKELLPVEWQPKSLWDWCMMEDEKKKDIGSMFL